MLELFFTSIENCQSQATELWRSPSSQAQSDDSCLVLVLRVRAGKVNTQGSRADYNSPRRDWWIVETLSAILTFRHKSGIKEQSRGRVRQRAPMTERVCQARLRMRWAAGNTISASLVAFDVVVDNTRLVQGKSCVLCDPSRFSSARDSDHASPTLFTGYRIAYWCFPLRSSPCHPKFAGCHGLAQHRCI